MICCEHKQLIEKANPVKTGGAKLWVCRWKAMTAKLLLIFLYFKRKKQEKGRTLLLHDGQVYDIYWITRVEEYIMTAVKLLPIRFVDVEENPFP